MEFNILSKLYEELSDFTRTSITLASVNDHGEARYLRNDSYGYTFRQLHTLNLIDLYYNSKFESGKFDNEGQRKVFLNIGKFRCDVAAMQTDIDVKDYVFVPDSQDDQWRVWLMSRRFKTWARQNYYGMLLNELNRDYSKYGTCVVKKVGKNLERVPLKTLKNTQDAKSLQKAVDGGGYVVQVHSMSYDELLAYPDWNLSKISRFKGKKDIYERYAYVPESLIKDPTKTQFDDNEKWVKSVAIICPTLKFDEVTNVEKFKGGVLFIEACDEVPYAECHWDKQDGRWLGIGEIENQFENQVARNITANLRNRSNQWASKRIFESTDESLKNKLILPLKDGQILGIQPNGNITQVNTQSQNMAEFAASEEMWDKNSDQKSFTYEVATGEALPSGTPLGLGVLLSNSTKKHFALKQQDFGLFLEKSFFQLIIPIFQAQGKEHTIAVAAGESGIENLKNAIVETKLGDAITEAIFSGKVPDVDKMKAHLTDQVIKSPYFFVDVPKNFYKDASFHMELNIVGEAINTQTNIQTLQFAYNALATKGDPRADAILELMIAETGNNLTAMIGNAAPAQPQQPQSAPQPGQQPPQGQPSPIQPGQPQITPPQNG